MLTTGGSGSGKTNALLNLIKKQDSDKLIVITLLTKFISMLKT